MGGCCGVNGRNIRLSSEDQRGVYSESFIVGLDSVIQTFA